MLELAEVAVRAGRPADGAAEEDVRREAVRAADEEREVVVAMAGRVERPHVECAALDRVAVREPPICAHVRRGMCEQRHAVSRRELLDADDVVAVAVCAENASS